MLREKRNQKELEEADRKLLGYGFEHIVLTIGEKDDTVVKIGTTKSINNHVDAFNKIKDIFPKVYRHGQFMPNPENLEKAKSKMLLKDTMYGFLINRYLQELYNNKPLGFMYVEKLNTEQFEFLTRYMKNYFDVNYVIVNMVNPSAPIFDKTSKKLKSENVHENIIKFFNDLKNIAEKLAQAKEIGLVTPNQKIFDLHSGNFGITSDGRVKLLDF